MKIQRYDLFCQDCRCGGQICPDENGDFVKREDVAAKIRNLIDLVNAPRGSSIHTVIRTIESIRDELDPEPDPDVYKRLFDNKMASLDDEGKRKFLEMLEADE